MQKDEQLRRRDPKAYMALILGRREREARHIQRYAPSHSLPAAALVSPITSTQPCWNSPMIATADMLLPPSTAPTATSGTGILLHTPSFANPSAAASPNLHRPESGPLPTAESKMPKGASVPAPNQTKTKPVGPRRLSRTPEFTSHDLQKHVEESITLLSNDTALQPEEAVREAIGNLPGDERKRSMPVDELDKEEHMRKKAKQTPAAMPGTMNFEAMKKTFDDLLSREATRSKGGS